MYLKDFSCLCEEVTSLERNTSKDNQQRRQNLQVISQRLADLNTFEIRLSKLRALFNESSDALVQSKVDAVKTCVREINGKIQKSKNVLLDRLMSLSNSASSESSSNSEIVTCKNSSDNSDNNHKGNSENMAEKFDLRTATSLLPCMDNSESTTKQLIDAMELYAQLLDDAGKILLVNYVLKVKLSQSAKLRLEKAYTSVESLIRDMKRHLLTKKSATALANQLHNAKQHQKSIDGFGKTIEELMVDLTLAQAENDENAVKVLSKINEKVAVNAFANGLKNHELRTIIKARNFDNLKDAVCAAVEEGRDIGETTSRTESQVFHMHGKKQFYNNSRYAGKHSSFNNSAHKNGNYARKHYYKQQNKNNNYQQNSYKGQYQARHATQASRFQGKSTGKVYTVNSQTTDSASADVEFFRDSQ